MYVYKEPNGSRDKIKIKQLSLCKGRQIEIPPRLKFMIQNTFLQRPIQMFVIKVE